MADRDPPLHPNPDHPVHPTSEEPIQEPLQPDPYLSEGRARRWAIWGTAAAIAAVVCLVLYALNARSPEPRPGGTAQTPASSSSSPASGGTTGSGSK